MKFDALHNRQFLEWVFTPTKEVLSEMDQNPPLEPLKRTESSTARENFENTHDGSAPVLSGATPSSSAIEMDLESLSLPPPKRSDTRSTMASTSTVQDQVETPKERPRQSLSQRLGFRRRSADIIAAARGANSNPSLDPAQSYFNLYRGSVPAIESKVRNDQRLERLNELYSLSKILFDFIGPQEYGITDTEKLEIGLLTSLPLLKEIVSDLEEVQASESARSFVYFTKESHIYTLLNCILEGGVSTKIARNAIPELDYLSQICFELYESANSDADHDPANPDANYNYSIRITLSPGCHTFDPLDVQMDSKHCIGCAPRRSLTSHGQWNEVLETLKRKFHTVKLPTSFTAVNLSERHPQDFVEGAQEEDVEVVRAQAEEASGIAPVH